VAVAQHARKKAKAVIEHYVRFNGKSLHVAVYELHMDRLSMAALRTAGRLEEYRLPKGLDSGTSASR
jgi:hypothetical protein